MATEIDCGPVNGWPGDCFAGGHAGEKGGLAGWIGGSRVGEMAGSVAAGAKPSGEGCHSLKATERCLGRMTRIPHEMHSKRVPEVRRPHITDHTARAHDPREGKIESSFFPPP